MYVGELLVRVGCEVQPKVVTDASSGRANAEDERRHAPSEYSAC